MDYKVVVHESEEGFSVSCPGLPGCWSQGATEDEALANIQDAIREYLDAVRAVPQNDHCCGRSCTPGLRSRLHRVGLRPSITGSERWLQAHVRVDNRCPCPVCSNCSVEVVEFSTRTAYSHAFPIARQLINKG